MAMNDYYRGSVPDVISYPVLKFGDKNLVTIVVSERKTCPKTSIYSPAILNGSRSSVIVSQYIELLWR